VYKRQALDTARFPPGELCCQPASEAVPDPHPGSVGDAGEDIAEVCVEVPRRFPVGVPVAAQVGGDDVVPVCERLGQPLEAPAVGSDAVEADDRRRARLTPLVEVQRHGR